MKRYGTLLLVLSLTAPALLAQAGAPPAPAKIDPQALGRQLTAWFYAGEVDRLWERFSPEMKKALGSADNVRAFRGQVEAQLGVEKEVVSETVMPIPPYQVYARTARMSKSPKPVVVQWSLDAAGVVAGFFVRPSQEPEPAPTKYLEYQTKTPLHLPFEGEWFVVWGGRTVEQNYHVVAPDQRFAYDILALKDGATHTGDGGSVEQYYCWGRPILAPAAGTVAEAVDGLPDNKPGVMDPAHPPGNHVILDHGNGEFSLLAHLQKGSVAVKKGDVVKTGDRLGKCGNSGNTTEPHLHYHLQNTAVFGQGEGLPAQFLDYVANGKDVARGEPVKWQTIRPRTAGSKP